LGAAGMNVSFQEGSQAVGSGAAFGSTTLRRRPFPSRSHGQRIPTT
jgi:hypothetical protein